MPTIFSKILAGDIPGQIIYTDEHCGAFLDVNPINPGHTLLVPREEAETIYDVSSNIYHHLWDVVPRLAAAIKKVTGCMRVAIAVVGVDVAHAHIHLIPVHGPADVDFSKATPADPADLAAMREKIVAEL